MNEATICTIAALNYLPQVRVLHRSLVRTNPGVHFTAFIVDDVERLGTDEDFETIDATEVIDPRELARMATMYDVTELSTALKPFALASVQTRFGGAACYLDPDVVVFGDLEACREPSPGHAAALTPHCLDPIPRDGLEPHDVYIQAAGSFNLGYCAVAHDEFGHRLLEWWSERLLRDAISDPSNHRFTDQRWMDLAVSHFEIEVLRDPTMNVAYWNLHERTLDVDGVTDGVPEILVDGRPLTFFHFSGFDADDPERISRHLQRPRRSVDAAAWTALAAFYRRELAAAARPDDAALYGYAATARGQVIAAGLRRRYRDEVLHQEDVMTTLGWRLQAGRPDLPGEPPAAFAADGGAAFGAWSGHDRACSRRSTAGAALAEHGIGAGARGVNLVGHLGAESGVGEAARLLHHGLRVAGVPVTTTEVTAPWSRHGLATAPPSSDERPFDHDLLVVNADQTTAVRSQLPRQAHHRRVAGFWAWETEALPSDQIDAFEHVDVVLTYSTHAADAIRATARRHRIDVPVLACPPPIATDMPAVDMSRADLGLPDGPLVLFCFDHLSVMERKNPGAAVEAFRRAVPRAGAATLLIKSSNAAARRTEHERLLRTAADRSDIVVFDSYLSPVRVRALMRSADVYLSLHRCEGFGLTVAEAMATGTAVVSTAYSGTMEFTTPDAAELVPYRLVEIPDAVPHYGGTGRWAEPDVDAAAESLARLLDDGEERRALGSRGRDWVATTLDPVTRGAELVRLLELDRPCRREERR